MAEENEERVVEVLSTSIAAVSVASDPYWAATDLCGVASAFIVDHPVATSLYLVWSALTDRWELRPRQRDDTVELMRRAAAEWAGVAHDKAAREVYLDRWQYEVCGYARPGAAGHSGAARRRLGAARAWKDQRRSGAAGLRGPSVGRGGDSGGEPFALRALDQALENASLLAWVAGVRASDGGDVLEVDLALHLGWVKRPRDEGALAATVGLRCRGVRGWTLSAERVDSVRIVDDHPALVPFEPSWSRLSYRGEPADPDATLAALHVAHARAAGSGVPMFLQPGSAFARGWFTGTVAEGPTSLLETYADALRRQGLDAVLTSTSAPADTTSRAAPKACEIGSGYVLADQFETYGNLSRDGKAETR